MSLERLLVIIDQADKLKCPSLHLFMNLYNETKGSCGFILSGVEALSHRVLRGVRAQKVGYDELYSRLGRKFITFSEYRASQVDVSKICKANGISDKSLWEQCYTSCGGDLRRVKRFVDVKIRVAAQQKQQK